MSSAAWDKAKAAALKILGKDAEVPDVPDNIDSAADTLGKANGDFDKARGQVEDALLAVQNANDAVKNAIKQFGAKIEKADFKLDSKNKDNVKKIEQARKLLTGTIASATKFYDQDDKMLDELDKHIIQLGKYKPKPSPI